MKPLIHRKCAFKGSRTGISEVEIHLSCSIFDLREAFDDSVQGRNTKTVINGVCQGSQGHEITGTSSSYSSLVNVRMRGNLDVPYFNLEAGSKSKTQIKA
jgi:hypothetical protein